jgi:hypothetical protein
MVSAGCGSSGSATAPSTPKQIASDKRLATLAALRAIDMPDGFKATKHDTSPADALPRAAAEKLAECAHMPEAQVMSTLNGSAETGMPTVDSPDFEKKTPGGKVADTMISSSVEVDRSSKDLSVPIGYLGAARAIPCWKTFLQTAFADPGASAGGSIGDLRVTTITIAGVGDQSAAIEASLNVTASGRTVPLYTDVFLVRRGRAGVSLEVTGIGGRVSRALEKSLLETVVGRLGAAA